MEVIAGTSEELIRRSDAIKAIEPYLDYIESITLCGAKPYVREAIYGIRSKIKFIPTIEPKRGRWIPVDNGHHVRCSECGRCGFASDNFCSNCGCAMTKE